MRRSGAERRFVFVAGTSEPGGLHIHTAEVAQACADMGHHVSILCPSVNHFEGLISDPRIEVRRVPPAASESWQARVDRWRRYGREFSRPDIVFCQGHIAEIELFDLYAAAVRARRVYTIEHRCWSLPWRRPLSKATYGRLSAAVLRRSIAVSGEIETVALHDFKFPRRKVKACLNWVHPCCRAATRDERRRARAAFDISPSALLIGYAGRLAPEKRVDVLLRSFASSVRRRERPIVLAIIGDGWKREALEQLSVKLGIAEDVRFLGWTRTPWALLSALDIFVLPSLEEGFPLSLMEAMSVGCACLVHPMSSATRLIESGISGALVDMTSVEGLAFGLDGLIDIDSSGRERMGLAAASRIADEFSRDRRLPDVLAALDLPVGELPPARPRLLDFNRT